MIAVDLCKRSCNNISSTSRSFFFKHACIFKIEIELRRKRALDIVSLYSLTCTEYWCLVYRPIVPIRRIHHAMERCVVIMKETVTHYSESRLRSSFPLDVMLDLLHFLWCANDMMYPIREQRVQRITETGSQRNARCHTWFHVKVSCIGSITPSCAQEL
jgi:hypothetical protein